MVRREDVVSFKYKGDDSMISFKAKKTPKCPKEFRAEVVLRSGEIVDARMVGYRYKIWEWWYESRKREIEEDILIQAARSMVVPLGYKG